MRQRSTPLVDSFLLMLIATVGIAVVLPARGAALPVVSDMVPTAIALLFFLYGLRLAPMLVVRGLAHWRLQGLVLASTFVIFPLVGLAMATLVRPLLPAPLVLGLMFASVLPSTVQSSIAFTTIARGNVGAALCSASLSNLLGIVLTPLLVALVLGSQGGALRLDAVREIAMQLLLPFVIGQALRPLLADWVMARGRLTAVADRASILIVVYAAFSEGMDAGVWSLLTISNLALIILLDGLLLGIVLAATTVLSRKLGFCKDDEIAIVFCGSKKSLGAGIPMANVLFPGRPISLILLPLLLFHQIQLFVCAIMASRYSRRPGGEGHSHETASALRKELFRASPDT